MKVALAATLFLVASASAVPVSAAITCTTGTRVAWPDTGPAVWEMCVLPPSQSSSTAGSALELRFVHHRGKSVLKRVNTPVLNVNYVTGCGCYRDWADEEMKFQVYQADPGGGPPILATGPTGSFVDAVEPPLTVCENGGSRGDIPAGTGFRGVAIERLSDRLILTTQISAGWYRYLVKYTFHGDGRIEPRFGFGAVQASCVANNSHRHHVYWRFDFDIDGAGTDAVGRPGTRQVIGAESMRTMQASDELSGEDQLVASSIPYIVHDTVTRRGYRVAPGPGNLDSPVGGHPSWGGPVWNGQTYPFDVADAFMLQYKESSPGIPAEINDGVGFSSSQCALTTNFMNFMNGEAINDGGDLVTWYRGGGWHAAGDVNVCEIVGPNLYPLGAWDQ